MDIVATMINENHQFILYLQGMIEQQQKMINTLNQRLGFLEKRLNNLEFGGSIDTEDFQKIVKNQDELHELLEKLNPERKLWLNKN